MLYRLFDRRAEGFPMPADPVDASAPPTLDAAAIRAILRRPNGQNIVLDLVREGRIPATLAVEEIDAERSARESSIKSFANDLLVK